MRKQRQRENLDEYYVEKTREYDRMKAAKRRQYLKELQTENRDESSKRQARSRQVSKLVAKSENEFDVVMDEVVTVALDSPSKKEKLLQLLSPGEVSDDSDKPRCASKGNFLLELKCFKLQNKVQKHGELVKRILDKYGSKRKAAEAYGLHYKTFYNLCQPPQTKTTLRHKMFIDRKDQVSKFMHENYVSKVLPNARLAHKHFMIQCLEDSHKQYVEWCKEKKINAVAFSTYCRLKPKDVYTMQETPENECCCKICLNVGLLKKAMSVHGIKGIPSSSKEAIKVTFCEVDVTDVSNTADPNYGSYSCISRRCKSCGVSALLNKIKQANPGIEHDKKIVNWKRWDLVKKDGRLSKVIDKVDKSTTKFQVIQQYVQDIDKLSLHLFNWKWHEAQFEFIKNNLPKGVLLQVLDFAQNYLNRYQDEPQSCYWVHSQTVIHPIVNYYRCPQDEGLIVEEHVMITDDLNHDKHAVKCFEDTTLEYFHQKGFTPKAIIQFCDNCSKQYKSKGPFQYLGASKIPVMRTYFGASHGKGPSDAATGRVKQAITKARVSREAEIRNSKEFHQVLEKKFEGWEIKRKKKLNGKCMHFRQKTFHLDNIDRTQEIYAVTIDGTQSFSSVRSTGIENIIETRHVGCLCPGCVSGEQTGCPNNHYCGRWERYNLINGAKVKGTCENQHWPIGARKQEENVAHKPNGTSNDKAHSASVTRKPKKNVVHKPKATSKEKAHSASVTRKPKNNVVHKPKATSSNKTHLASVTRKPVVVLQPLTFVSRGCRNINWIQLQQEIMNCRNFQELKQFATIRCLANIFPIHNNVQQVRRGHRLDEVAQYEMNQCTDAPNLIPISIFGDGNCLPRTLSTGIFGSDNQYIEMRLRILIEGVLHTERYLHQRYMALGASRKYKKTKNLATVYAQYSKYMTPFPPRVEGETDYVRNLKVMECLRQTFEKELFAIRKPGEYMSMWQLFQAANCINRPIRVFFPRRGSDDFRADFNRMVKPWDPRYRNREPLVIMWTPTVEDGEVNHFVPLLEM